MVQVVASAAGKTVNPHYRLHHPKWHRRRMPIFWWLEKLTYSKFITRELTSFAVCYSAILLLVQIWALSQGEAAYERFLTWLRWPPALVLHVLVLSALVFHALTWLNLAPKAMVLRVGRRRLPDAAVLIAHYLAWLAATAVILVGVSGL